MENKIIINVEAFKEILLNGWHLLPQDKQAELIGLDIYPKTTVPSK